MVDNDDEAMARMRASDPATGSHPDLHALRQRIAQKAPASQGSDSTTRLHDDVFRGQGLRAPWIAAAAVAAFGFGAGGYAVGAQQAPDTGGQIVAGAGEDTTDGAEATSVPEEGRESAVSAAGSDGAAAGEGKAGMGGDSPAAWDPGPVRLVAGPDLPTEGGTGEVRAVMSEEDPAEFLDAWAERLGFEGVRAAEGGDGGWFTGNSIYDVEGGRMLTVHRDGGAGLSFSYEDMLSSPWCAENYGSIPEPELETVRAEWAKAFGEDVSFPDASMCKDVSGDAPNDEQALAAAHDFLTSTGIDLSDYTLQVPDYGDESVNTVMVEGFPEGQQHGQLMVNAQVGPDGVISAYGSVGELTSLGEYPLISPAEAVERYGQREFSQEYGVSLSQDIVEGETGASTMPVEPAFELPEPMAIEPGMKIPMLLQEKVVTRAELTTGTIWAQTSGPLEVPAWKLYTEDGMHYAVMALSDEAIDWQGWDK